MFFYPSFHLPTADSFHFFLPCSPKSLVWPQLFSAYKMNFYFTKRKVVIQCDFQIFFTYKFNYLYSYLISLLSQVKDTTIFSKIHCMTLLFFLKLSFNFHIFFLFSQFIDFFPSIYSMLICLPSSKTNKKSL